MIKAALALKAGWMARFRSAFKNLLCQHVKVYHGEPPWVGRAEPAAYRACVIQLFSNCKRDQVESVSKLLNGDWQSDREIAHYCGGPSCCSSRDHTIAKMLESLVPVLIGKGPIIFPKHKWTGADQCCDYFGRLMCIHSILARLLGSLWSKENETDNGTSKSKSEQQKQPDPIPIVDDESGTAAADDEAAEDAVLAQLVQIRLEAADGVAPEDEKVDGDDFKAIAKQWRQVAVNWVCSKGVCQDLLTARMALGPQARLMRWQLKLGADKFDLEQTISEAKHGIRTYRVLEAHLNSGPAQLMSDMVTLINQDFSETLPLSFCTQEHRWYMFRLFARVAAAGHHYLWVPHFRYPFKIFGLLSHDAKYAEKVEQDILCDWRERKRILDPFSSWSIEPYIPDSNSEQQGGQQHFILHNAVAMAELKSVALECGLDISHTECQHAANRRLVQSRSTHTHPTDLASASNQFIHRQLRRSCFIGFQDCRDQPVKKFKKKTGRKKTRPRQAPSSIIPSFGVRVEN